MVKSENIKVRKRCKKVKKRKIRSKISVKRRWFEIKKRRDDLHKQLKIPANKSIPITLLKRIRDAEIGDIITNPTKTGKKKIKVTKTLKQRVAWVILQSISMKEERDYDY